MISAANEAQFLREKVRQLEDKPRIAEQVRDELQISLSQAILNVEMKERLIAVPCGVYMAFLQDENKPRRKKKEENETRSTRK